MVTIELLGWITLGFLSTYAVLELGTRILAARISDRLFLRR
jgi:hypothetical protein